MASRRSAKLSISLEPELADRLRRLADESFMGNVSAAAAWCIEGRIGVTKSAAESSAEAT